MRASVASISKKIISTFFAATLVFSLMPITAFAQPAPAAVAAENSESAAADSDMQAEAEASAYGENQTASSADVISSEGDEVPEVEKSRPSSEGEGNAQAGDGSNPAVPAGDIINQEMELDTVVAQAESTRSFFLAQTLESTRTVPVVSAKLPIDTNATDDADAPTDDGASSSEGEGSDGSEGAPESDDPVDPSFTLGSSEGDSAAMAAESTVIGSFTYLGMTFAIEPGGESVALMAVDYSKLPEEFVQKQVLVIPDAATPDGVDYYSVTRIADDAFAGLTKDNADPDYVGCEALFSDEELLAEAGIDPSEVAEFLGRLAGDDGVADDVSDGAGQPGDGQSNNSGNGEGNSGNGATDRDQTSGNQANGEGTDGSDDGAAAAAQDGESANADSDIAQKRKASAYEDQDQATSESVEGDNDDVRTIVSMEGNAATLDDGSTYEFTNPLAGCAGILALGIPASVTDIEDDAFSGFSTLQYVVVSEDNTSFASYDGALYSADESQLRLIPEGRVGAVRVAPSATGVDPEVFSHCPSVDALVADAEGEGHRDKVFMSMRDLPITVLRNQQDNLLNSTATVFLNRLSACPLYRPFPPQR